MKFHISKTMKFLKLLLIIYLFNVSNAKHFRNLLNKRRINCHIGEVGNRNYCTRECPCNINEGDCDSKSECTGDLLCWNNVGKQINLGTSEQMFVYQKNGENVVAKIPVETLNIALKSVHVIMVMVTAIIMMNVLQEYDVFIIMEFCMDSLKRPMFV